MTITKDAKAPFTDFSKIILLPLLTEKVYLAKKVLIKLKYLLKI